MTSYLSGRYAGVAPVSSALSLEDSLQLFFNEARRHPLLTAAEEVELAKRIERGDLAAKERMINANLRLVIWSRASTRARACPSVTSSRRACSV